MFAGSRGKQRFARERGKKESAFALNLYRVYRIPAVQSIGIPVYTVFTVVFVQRVGTTEREST
jgi:hypothetical protein